LLLELGQGSNFTYLATTIDQLEAAEKPQAGDLPGKLLRLARPLEDESIGQLLDCVRIRRHEDKHGYRWYGYYRLPEEFGRQGVSVRLYQNEDDKHRKINRTENLRPMPEGSFDYERLHVLRPDAQSMNRAIEDTLYINRASAKGWRRQMVDLLGHARLVNAITLAGAARGSISRWRPRSRATPRTTPRPDRAFP